LFAACGHKEPLEQNSPGAVPGGDAGLEDSNLFLDATFADAEPGDTGRADAGIKPPIERCNTPIPLRVGEFVEVAASEGRNDHILQGCGYFSFGELAELVFTFTPTITGAYETGWGFPGPPAEMLIVTDCQNACESEVARIPASDFAPGLARVQLNAGVSYSMILNYRLTGSPGDDTIYAYLGEPCISQCAPGDGCGQDDGCGFVCVACGAGEECVEESGICEPVASLCEPKDELPFGPCSEVDTLCDPRGCVGGCQDQCGYSTCTFDQVWEHHEWYAPTSCAYEQCPTLPLALPFNYASDFTSATAALPLDSNSGECGAEHAIALEWGYNFQHAEFVTGRNGWTIDSASDGELYPAINSALGFAHFQDVELGITSPSGVSFRLAFQYGPQLLVQSIAPQ
jgi:hypothetical protein